MASKLDPENETLTLKHLQNLSEEDLKKEVYENNYFAPAKTVFPLDAADMKIFKANIDGTVQEHISWERGCSDDQEDRKQIEACLAVNTKSKKKPEKVRTTLILNHKALQ
jgi:hypothetical protein